MREHPINNNPWAEKLEQVSLPDAGEARQKMLALLDTGMPPRSQWGLLSIVLLVLLTGVCNCPGHVSTKGPVAHRPVAGNSNTAGLSTESSKPVNDLSVDNTTVATYSNNKSELTAAEAMPVTTIKTPAAVWRSNSGPHRNARHSNKTRAGHITSETAKDDETSEEKNTAGNNTIMPSPTTAPVADTPIGKHPDTTQLTINVTEDSVAKKPQEEDDRGLAFAIGFNQAIPSGGLGDIGKSSGNGNSILGNYIPVPQLRYHFNDKWYVQFEVAVHAPQYTRALLLRQQFDTLPSTGIHNSVYLKKLFYLQLPLSVYYSPFKHFYAGAGIQAGILNNAFGLYETRRTGQNPQVSSKIQSLKTDTMSLYPTLEGMDWQWFADVSYHWTRLSGGVRYSNGFSPYIDIPVPGGANAKATNHTLQLYLRYTLWKQAVKTSAVK